MMDDLITLAQLYYLTVALLFVPFLSGSIIVVSLYKAAKGDFAYEATNATESESDHKVLLALQGLWGAYRQNMLAVLSRWVRTLRAQVAKINALRYSRPH